VLAVTAAVVCVGSRKSFEREKKVRKRVRISADGRAFLVSSRFRRNRYFTVSIETRRRAG